MVTVAPLVIPSYVGALMFVVALGPKGMLQDYLAPLGVNRLPDLYGYPGALITLSLLSFPYVLLTIRAGAVEAGPRVGGILAKPRPRTLGNLLSRHPAATPSGDRRRGIARGPLYAERLRGGVAAAV